MTNVQKIEEISLIILLKDGSNDDVVFLEATYLYFSCMQEYISGRLDRGLISVD